MTFEKRSTRVWRNFDLPKLSLIIAVWVRNAHILPKAFWTLSYKILMTCISLHIPQLTFVFGIQCPLYQLIVFHTRLIKG